MNYQMMLLDLIKNLDHKPKLLLHTCCGPCSTTCLEILSKHFDITVYYYNPNIEPYEEYILRKKEQIRYIEEAGLDVKFLDCDYDHEDFQKIARGLEEEKEGRARCYACYTLRLSKTAQTAKRLGFEYFGTTLTVSPHKKSALINQIGAFQEKKYGVKYLYSDFKKNEGYKRSVELAKKYNLYRQNYCGCLYGRSKDDS